MSSKNKIWRYASIIFVSLLLINPELIELALFIDAIGLELFIIMLEVQLFSLLGVYFNGKINPVLKFIGISSAGNLYLRSRKKLKESLVDYGIAGQSPAILMCLLVLSSFSGTVNTAI